jgi:hypothetical protein
MERMPLTFLNKAGAAFNLEGLDILSMAGSYKSCMRMYGNNWKDQRILQHLL